MRELFTAQSLLGSSWYESRLRAKQLLDIRQWQRHIKAVETFLGKETHSEEATRLGLSQRLKEAHQMLREVEMPEYLVKLRGTLGLQPELV